MAACTDAAAGYVASTDATKLQVNTGATQQTICGDGTFKAGAGAVSLFAEILVNPSDLQSAGTYTGGTGMTTAAAEAKGDALQVCSTHQS